MRFGPASSDLDLEVRGILTLHEREPDQHVTWLHAHNKPVRVVDHDRVIESQTEC
jgi:hypothetical protein